MGEWRYSSTIPDLGTKWRWVVSFTPWLLYPRGKSPRHPLDRRLGGPQNSSGRYGEEECFLPLTEIEPRPSSPWPIPITSELETDKNIIQVSKMKFWEMLTKLGYLQTAKRNTRKSMKMELKGKMASWIRGHKDTWVDICRVEYKIYVKQIKYKPKERSDFERLL
jgi:hypothetical protein